MEDNGGQKQKMKAGEVFRILGRLYWTTREHFGWGFLRMLGGYASAGLGVFGSWLTGTILDVAISGDMERFKNFVLLFLLLFVSRGIVNFVNPLTGRRYSIYSGRKLMSLTAKKINRLPISYYEKTHTAQVVSRLSNDITALQDYYGNSIAGIWSFVPFMMISSLWVLISIDPWLTLISCSIIPVILYFMGKISIPIGDASKRRQEHVAEYNSYLRDFLEGIHIYIAYNMKRVFAGKFQKACLAEYEEAREIAKRRSKAIGVNILSAIIPQILAYGIGGVFVVRGSLTIGELVIFANVIWPLLNSVRQLSQTWSDFVTHAGKAKHMFELLDDEEERNNGKDFESVAEKSMVEFRNVSFSYNDEESVLDGVGFKIMKGSKVALVGESGGGKSTVHKLILGYYDSYGGDIYFMDREISRWNLEYLREKIAFVSQEVYLFNDTILENIRIGNPEATDDEVKKAAEEAYAHDFICGLPDGYMTEVGERGARLSGGQKQRIAIARAILKDAPVLLLDEPTSALDTRAEYFVQLALEKLEEGKTVFVIAHRLSTIENADEIIVLENGRIIEKGSHVELSLNGKRYKELYKSQLAQQTGGVMA